MGRLFARGALALSLVFAVFAATPASPSLAQTAPEAALRLVSESTWTGTGRPLFISFTATNTSSVPLGTLSVVLSIWTPARSRSLYELTLKGDATTVLLSRPFPQSGSLLPGETRTFSLREELDALGARDNALYPVKVQLLSADAPVGTLRTPMIFLIERPRVPLNLTWSWVLSDPLQLGPDGAFGPGPIEQDIAPGGRLDAMVGALANPRMSSVDVVVSSVLVEELQRMAAGYRIEQADGSLRPVAAGTGGAADAKRMLGVLTRIVARPHTELVATPLGDPSEPALIRAGLGPDIPTLTSEGSAAVATALGGAPATGLARPIFSALNGPTLNRLTQDGIGTVLLDSNFVTPPPGVREAASPVARFVSGSHELDGVLPDPGVAAVASEYQADPVLDAHASLGELAAIWLELPGTPGRGAAILFPEGPSLPPAFFGGFAQLVVGSPWLAAVPATDLAAVVGTPEPQPVPVRTGSVFPVDYVLRLKEAKSRLNHFAEAAVGAKPLVDRLHQRLLMAESATFISSTARGDRFVDSTLGAIRATYSSIQIATTQVTLTSRSGVLPITIKNATGYSVQVVLRFVSDRRLQFESGETYRVLLTGPSKTLTFRVRAETTGRFPIKVDVETPAIGTAADTIAQTVMIVRSTAYNKVALFVTIGAALFLAAWWGRRFLPRTKP